jgi:DNA-binding NarL/FixJ family response regulator
MKPPRPGRQKAEPIDFSFAALKTTLFAPNVDRTKFDTVDLQALLRSYLDLAKTAIDLERAIALPKEHTGRRDLINDLWLELMKRSKMAWPHSSSPPFTPPNVSVTPRQQDVLAKMLQGKSNGQIAKDLNISMGTTKVHVREIIRAFGVGTRAEMMAAAHQRGL